MTAVVDDNGDLPTAAYAAALACLPGVGPAWLAEVIVAHGPRQAWELVATGQLRQPARVRAGQKRAGWSDVARYRDVGRLWAECVRSGIGVTWPSVAGYPAVLASGPAPAGVLFWAGDAAMLDGRPAVAVVGTRRCTPEGAEVAYRLGHDLSEAGVRVVSGLALGIDGAAHAGALAANRGSATRDAAAADAFSPGSTVGVAASGVDVVYPRRHVGLWRQVVRTGVVISETPPGLPAQAWRFPARNRIIAGLAQMVVVVECHASGGSWHTVDAALRRGIEVGAVPGSVHSSASVGTNTLLHEGATPVRGAQDVLDALGVFNSTPRGSHTREAHKTVGARRETGGTGAPVQAAQLRMLPDDPLCALEAKVLAAVGWQPRCLEEIIERSGLPVTAVVMSLEQLEQRGTITGEAGWWSRKSS